MIQIEDSLFDSLINNEPRVRERNKINKSGDKRGNPGEAKENSGRAEGDTNIPPVIKDVIAQTALTDTGQNVAEAFGVSQSTVARHKDGANLAKFVEAAQEQAAEKLLGALGVITPEEVGCAKLTDKIKVAEGMAGIISKLGKREQQGVVQQVIIYQPEKRDERSYEVIDV